VQPSFGLTWLKRKTRLTSATLLEDLIFSPAFAMDFSSTRTCFLKSRAIHVCSYRHSYACVSVSRFMYIKEHRGSLNLHQRATSFFLFFFFFFFSQEHVVYFIQCTCFPVMLMSTFYTNVLKAIQEAFGSPFFVIFASRLSSILFTCSSPGSGAFYNTLNLADVAGALLANSIPQSGIANDAPQGLHLHCS